MSLIKFLVRLIASVIPVFVTPHFFLHTSNLRRYLVTGFYKSQFRKWGKLSSIDLPIRISGASAIEIGANCVLGKHGILTVFNIQNDGLVISIGNNVNIGVGYHISAINSIEIGDDVLMGNYITIVDNSHGNSSDPNSRNISPYQREIFSKGKVKIHNSVWIGDKVTICPGVEIGENSIVGANSVVTKDVPPNAVVGGIPAKVVSVIASK